LTGEDVLYDILARKFATCGVSAEADGYHVNVQDETFRGLSRSDRESRVYEALERVPLTLLARVRSITCVTADD
jgi:hypothetical protein